MRQIGSASASVSRAKKSVGGSGQNDNKLLAGGKFVGLKLSLTFKVWGMIGLCILSRAPFCNEIP